MTDKEIQDKVDIIMHKIMPNNGFIKCGFCGEMTCMYSETCTNCLNKIS